MENHTGSLGKSSFEYNNLKDSHKKARVLMCDQEMEGKVEIGYFVIGKPSEPKDHDNIEDQKLEAGEVMICIPEQCLERMAFHYDMIRRRRHELEQEKAVEESQGRGYRPQLRRQP